MIYLDDLRELDNAESSIGVIRKWYDEKNNYYIKASSLDKSNHTYHVEAIMECIAYEVGLLLGIDVVPYWLDKLYISEHEIIDVCVSEDYFYKRPIKEKVSAFSYLLKLHPGKLSREEQYNRITSISEKIKLDIDKMLVFDYLIDNYDRHLRNIEIALLKDGTITIAPIFDNGSSLLANWEFEEDLLDLKENEDLFEQNILHAETPAKAFANEHAIEIRMVGKEVYNHINLNIENKEFKSIIEKYSDYLSPLRKELIYKLLIHRYENIQKRAKSSV
ncbi:hypothetical protein [Neobacillus cucumis]|uniref:HipA-like C-terminal domain-containing protein n=1 Tax=Neobacillus cucumis TaxID=1740721 RepID=A0A2N5HAA1_9BACI|nr:hypothetical protein [Neobacillus cucumis]PLS02456.1 hypothetical protein CVD27_20100 [Neobacillus cucumis]